MFLFFRSWLGRGPRSRYPSMMSSSIVAELSVLIEGYVYVPLMLVKPGHSYRISHDDNQGTESVVGSKPFLMKPLTNCYVVATLVFYCYSYFLALPGGAPLILYLFVVRLLPCRSSTLGWGKDVEQAHTLLHAIRTDRTDLLGLYPRESARLNSKYFPTPLQNRRSLVLYRIWVLFGSSLPCSLFPATSHS